MGMWTHIPVPALYIHININIVPPLGAYKSQLGGTYIYYFAVAFYIVNDSCDYIVYIYTYLVNHKPSYLGLLKKPVFSQKNI